MEIWTLNHPTYGNIAVEIGFDSEFLAIDPTWPFSSKPHLRSWLCHRFFDVPETYIVSTDTNKHQRYFIEHRVTPLRARIKVNEVVTARLDDVFYDEPLPLFGFTDDFDWDKDLYPYADPIFDLSGRIIAVRFWDDGEDPVSFTPREGSYAERIQNEGV